MKTLKLQMITFLFITMAISQLSAQEISTKYGKVTNDELSMTTYQMDTTANAVVIFSKGSTYYDYMTNGFRVTYEIEKKVKILKTEGTEYANVEIPYYHNEKNNTRKENIIGLDAVAYNLENGKVERTKMKSEYVFKERINASYMQLKFSIPAVKAGTVIEYKYKLTSDHIGALDPWEIQQDIPVIYSNYEITIPEYFKFNLDMRGGVSINTEDTNMPMNITLSGGDRLSLSARKLTFTANNIPALKADSYVWAPEDYKARIGFELLGVQFPYDSFRPFTTTWEKIDENLLTDEDFGKLLKMRNPFKDELQALKTEGLSQEEKIAAAFLFLKQKVSWNGKYGLYAPDIRKAIKESTGNNAELNFILMSMLRDMDINSVPVIMSRRDLGVIPIAHPSMSAINTFVVAILNPDGTIMSLLDGSVTNGYLDILPPHLMPRQARIVKKEPGDKWMDLSNLGNSQIKTMTTGTIQEDGTLMGERMTQYLGQHASSYRARNKAAKDSTEFKEKIETEESIQINGLSHENLHTFSPDVVEKISFTKQLDTSGDFIYFSPMVFKHMSENPFKQESRQLPVEFAYPYSLRMTNTINIPEGFQVDELPENQFISMEDKGITCRYMVQDQGDKIMMTYAFTMNKTFFIVQEYEELMKFFTVISDKNNQMVVLKRISE